MPCPHCPDEDLPTVLPATFEPCNLHAVPPLAERKKAAAFVALCLFGLIAASLFVGCQQAPAPAAATPQPVCVAGNGNGTLVCVDGNGNITTITIGSATPTPTPGPADCQKKNPLYQENVVIAWRSMVIPEMTAKAHIAGMIGALKTFGFEATSGGLLSGDELSVKTTRGPFSETYDVCEGDYATKCTPQVLYVSTCAPASFLSPVAAR